MICPDCGAERVLRRTTKYRYSNGEPRPFYGCSRYPDCTATHGAHPDGHPLGTPANRQTKEARIEAHKAFDRLWKDGHMSRADAYRWLARALNRPDAHIGSMEIDDCKAVIEAVSEWKKNISTR